MVKSEETVFCGHCGHGAIEEGPKKGVTFGGTRPPLSCGGEVVYCRGRIGEDGGGVVRCGIGGG